jgi:C4-dicarboxylate-specific signal transduction histidine kinase
MSLLHPLPVERLPFGERIRDRLVGVRAEAAHYLLALLFVGAAIGVTVALHYFNVEHNRFQFYAAIAAAAWFGGAGPGCMAAIMAALGVEYFFTPPLYNLKVYPHELPDFVTFIACAAISFAISTRLRRAERELQRAHQSLETTVAQRTAELRQTNAALTIEIAERERADRERAESETALADTQAQLARVLRLATVAECAAVAHEVKQPLTAIAANAGACLRWLEADPPVVDMARQAVAGIVEDGKRAGAVISRIGGLLRNRKPSIGAVDLNALIAEVLAMAGAAAEKDRVVVRTSLARNLPPAAGDPVYLQQVLLNLVTNALEAMRGIGERQRVLTLRSRLQPDGAILVEVEDTGIGFARADPKRLFESFYTTKAEGLGMGLAISRSIVTKHGGRLSAAPGRRHGAVFRLTLPVAASADR